MEFEGETYTFNTSTDPLNTNSTTNYPIRPRSAAKESDWFIEDGYLVYKIDLQWTDNMYCRPIPTTALTLNPKIGQNNGWN